MLRLRSSLFAIRSWFSVRSSSLSTFVKPPLKSWPLVQDGLKYDVLLPDVNNSVLKGEVSKLLGHPYLSPVGVTGLGDLTFEGKLFGPYQRPFISLPFSVYPNTSPIWVHFLVDTGAPFTTISPTVLQELNVNVENPPPAMICNQRASIQPSQAHYVDINLLGADFLHLYNAALLIYYSKQKFQIKLDVID